MPRPRTKQSPVVSASLVGPGFIGLNTEQETTIGVENPAWALQLDNAVFGNRGFLTFRKGHIIRTTTPMSGAPGVHVLHEYTLPNGARQLLGVASDFTLQMSADDGVTWTDVTGSVSTTTTRWKLVNFKGDVFACAPGQKVHQYTGSGNFTEIGESPVTSGVILAAFGRIWVREDGTDSVKHSALLLGDTWTGPGTGTVDASNAWTQEDDTITALGAFGATFVIFGRKHILLYVDGSGSVLGIDPTQMYVADTVEGTGCIEQNSVVSIGEGDLWFQSNQGIQSLSRVVVDKVNPLADVTKNVRTLVQSLQSSQTGSEMTVQAIYSPEDQFVLYLYPESNTIVMFDTRFRLEDGTFRVARWTSQPFQSMALRADNNIWFGLGTGEVAEYKGFRDDGVTYSLVYTSPWVDFGPDSHNRLKILKQTYVIFLCQGDITVTLKTATDFAPLPPGTSGFGIEQRTVSCPDTGGEWGIAEWGLGEFGSGAGLSREYFAGSGEGQYVQMQVTIKNTEHNSIGGLHEIATHARIGRVI